MAKKPGKTLAELKEDRQKAERDFLQFQRQIVMVQGIILYLDNEIQKLEQGGAD
jgi:hypothetical protein